jgi:hypothetical protein
LEQDLVLNLGLLGQISQDCSKDFVLQSQVRPRPFAASRHATLHQREPRYPTQEELQSFGILSI